MTHNFKLVNKLHKTKKGDKFLYECEKCDSAVAFATLLTQFEVNQAVMIKFPNLLCIPREK